MGSAVFCSAFLFKSILHFDPNLGLGSRFGGSEDADLFVRAIDLDIPVLFHNDLSIMHPKIYKGQYGLSSMYRYGLGRGAFYSKHIHKHFLLFIYRFLFEIFANLAFAIFSLLCLRINFAQRHLGLLVGKIVGFLTYDL